MRKKRGNDSRALKAVYATFAASASACFFDFPAFPLNVSPSTSTVEKNKGRWAGPDLVVSYVGMQRSSFWANSCKAFL